MSNIRPYVIINGVDSRTIQGLLITSLPPISKPAQRTLTETVDGKDGDSSVKLGYSAYDKPLGIALTFGYNVDDVIAFFNSEGTIVFSNEPDKLYNFEIFEAIDFEKLIRFKTATVTIHTQPFKFSTTENPLEFTDKEFNVVNNGNTDSRPNLVITGEGLATMQINGKNALNIDFGDAEQTLLIDSEGMNAYYTNNIKAIEAEIVPKQDLHGFDSPFIDSDKVNKVPYLSRALAGTAERIGNYEYNKLVGGTVAYNQIINGGNFTDASLWAKSNMALTVSDNVGTAIKTTQDGYLNKQLQVYSNHKYLRHIEYKGASGVSYTFNGQFSNAEGADAWAMQERIVNIAETAYHYLVIRTNETEDFKPFYLRNIFYIDLTQMLGATIADYIYSLEQAQAGAGVAYFKALGFNKDYYPYNAGELMSVKASAHVTKNAGGAVIQTVALDPNLELRGIPKLDSNNKLYYDGDTYSADGSVSRKYNTVALDSLTWTYVSDAKWLQSLIIPDSVNTVVAGMPNAISDLNINLADRQALGNTSLGYTIYAGRVYVRGVDLTEAQLRALITGKNLVYEIATPTNESAEPFNNPIAIDANGSEEFTDSRAVAIPVGHESYYANICDIEGFTEVNLVRAGVNLFNKNATDTTNGYKDNYYIQGLDGQETYSASYSISEYIPLKSGITVCISNVSGYNPGIAFYNNEKNYISSVTYSGNTNFTITTPNNTAFIRFSIYKPNIDIIQLELGSVATDYSAYAGEIFKAEFEQAGEPVTVYGGKYNFTTGLLELTHAITDLGGLTYTKQTSGDKWAFIANSPADSFNTKTVEPSNYPFKSELYPQTAYNPINEAFNCFTMNNQYTGASKVIRIRDTRYTDETAFKNAVQGYKLCYELNEHIFIELDEQVISALLGINNFYANTGNVTVIFVNDGQDETQTGAIVSFDLDESDLNKGDLANRLVSGNYANIRLKTGSNAIKFIGSVSAVGLDKYSRWL